MPGVLLDLTGSPSIIESLRSGTIGGLAAQVGRLGGWDLQVADEPIAAQGLAPDAPQRAVTYRGKPIGLLHSPDSAAHDFHANPTIDAIAGLIEHAVDRQFAIDDLADAMMAGYEELNMLYTLLPAIATCTQERDIGEALVTEATRLLDCGRASLLLLDDKRQSFRVLASRGLPSEAHHVWIPVSQSVAGRALGNDDFSVIDDIVSRPDLRPLSQGRYQSSTFVVVRVPIRARGNTLGMLTATDRSGAPEFTARDLKLLEGLSSVGASALMNCRLHATISRQMISTIRALASAVDAKDRYTHDHSARVASLCLKIAAKLQITDASALREIELAGLLHDVGKIGIPDSVLGKKTRLSAEELQRVRTHVVIGAQIVQNVDGLERVADGILHHHERYDGLGYPDGMTGDAIPMASRLVAVADTFDCLTSNRPYRGAIPPERAIEEILSCAGSQYDPTVVRAFVAAMRETKSSKTSRHSAQRAPVVAGAEAPTTS